jgi:hypothetical protein
LAKDEAFGGKFLSRFLCLKTCQFLGDLESQCAMLQKTRGGNPENQLLNASRSGGKNLGGSHDPAITTESATTPKPFVYRNLSRGQNGCPEAGKRSPQNPLN